MIQGRFKYFFPAIKKKQKNSHICKECNTDIIVGEKYMSVTYNDAFIIKLYGAFHLQCWEHFKEKNA